MRSLSKRNLNNSRQIYFRYVGVGLVNAAITIGVFIFTSSRFSFVTSYLVAYAVGLFINLYLQPKSVFKVKSNSHNRKRLFAANVITIGVGVGLNYLLDASSVEPFFAATITAMITVPIGFLLTKASLLGKLKSND